MSTKFRCTHVAGFDAEKNSYVKCNQLMKVPDDFVGKSVVCPKCRQPVEVPADIMLPAAESEVGSTTTVSAKPGNVMDIDFESGATAQDASKLGQRRDRCPQCGGVFAADGVCSQCDYIDPVVKAERARARQTPPKIAGFQLWLTQIGSDGVSIATIGYILLGICVVFCLLMITYGILSTSALGIALAVTSGFALFFLLIVFNKTRSLAKDPLAGLGPLAPFWSLLLLAARWLNWQQYDGKLAGRLIIDRREKPVGDDELPTLPGFKNCQVLDLENSSITDRGLLHLYGHHHLHCLVVRKTDVTPDGVARLQQSQPKLWIWY